MLRWAVIVSRVEPAQASTRGHFAVAHSRAGVDTEPSSQMITALQGGVAITISLVQSPILNDSTGTGGGPVDLVADDQVHRGYDRVAAPTAGWPVEPPRQREEEKRTELARQR